MTGLNCLNRLTITHLPTGEEEGIMIVRCGQVGPLCGCYCHLRRCMGGANFHALPLFLFSKGNFTIYGDICQCGILTKSEKLICAIYMDPYCDLALRIQLFFYIINTIIKGR